MLFLDPNKPIATCVSETCNVCPVHNTLHCHFRPRNLIHFLLVVFPSFLLGGFVIIWGYPLLFLISGLQWFLLIVYVLSVAGFFMTLKTFLCSQCMNFACPLNAVEDEIRRDFFYRNPEVAKAWGVDTKS